MISVNGFMVEDGDRSLPWGNRHYMPSVTARDFYTYEIPSSQEMVCRYGLAYRTREGAIARAKAMLGIDPKSVVEVGQVWYYGAIEVTVVEVTDTEVAVKNNHSSKLAVMDLSEFLRKFDCYVPS